MFHSLIPIGGQDRISPYNIKKTSDENKENYQFRDSSHWLIQYQSRRTTKLFLKQNWAWVNEKVK